jgi:hypothetical protein
MFAPRLRITPEAKQALGEHLARSGLSDPRATVLWASDGEFESLEKAKANARWCVAFYDGKTLFWFQKCKIGGLPFCFVQIGHRKRLNGATLDWTGGKFQVSNSAT